MAKTELRNDVHLERGRTIFKDANEHSDTTIISCYRLLTAALPSNQIKPNCADIFGLQCAMTVLKPKYEEVLYLRFFMGQSYAETAKQTQLSDSQVHRIERKAIVQLLKHRSIFLS